MARGSIFVAAGAGTARWGDGVDPVTYVAVIAAAATVTRPNQRTRCGVMWVVAVAERSVVLSVVASAFKVRLAFVRVGGMPTGLVVGRYRCTPTQSSL
jgi:hypothetical protein